MTLPPLTLPKNQFQPRPPQGQAPCFQFPSLSPSSWPSVLSDPKAHLIPWAVLCFPSSALRSRGLTDSQKTCGNSSSRTQSTRRGPDVPKLFPSTHLSSKDGAGPKALPSHGDPTPPKLNQSQWQPSGLRPTTHLVKLSAHPQACSPLLTTACRISSVWETGSFMGFSSPG